MGRALTEDRDVLSRVGGLVADAVDDEIPVGVGLLDGAAKGVGVLAVGDEGVGAFRGGALAAGEDPGFKVLLLGLVS